MRPLRTRATFAHLGTPRRRIRVSERRRMTIPLAVGPIRTPFRDTRTIPTRAGVAAEGASSHGGRRARSRADFTSLKIARRDDRQSSPPLPAPTPLRHGVARNLRRYHSAIRQSSSRACAMIANPRAVPTKMCRPDGFAGCGITRIRDAAFPGNVLPPSGWRKAFPS